MRGLLVCSLLPWLTGCVVLASTYEAEVARSRALEKSLNERRQDVTELERRVAALREEQQALELTTKALEEQRVDLMDRTEDLRLASEQLAAELQREKFAREEATQQVKALSGSYQSLVDELEQEVQSGRLEIQRLQGRLQVRALDRILFPSGSAQVTKQGSEVLTRVAEQVKKIPGQSVRIEGHTDNVPISTPRFPSNWELSAARAAQVVRVFEAAGIASDKLEAVGFGPNRPIESNATAEGRSRNRRIEIVLVPEEG